MRRFILVAAGCSLAACGDAQAVIETDEPDPSTSEYQAVTLPTALADAVYASGFTNPTAMEFAPDGRLFVAQQNGRLRVVKNGQVLATPFLTLTVSSVGERGLLGVAFDPAFAMNRFVYVYYTATTPAVHNRVSRFTANGDVAVAGSEKVLLELNDLSSATNHNGGAIHFGPDGKLYVAVGENATRTNSQSLNNLLGKMLRINSDGTIPQDNPFVTRTTGNNRAIWALGLRNPFTFAFQPGTGKMFINDVGEQTWEEINLGVRGANYGWPQVEGMGPASAPATLTKPVHVYGHGQTSTTGCSIAGGAFYNPETVLLGSTYVGSYFFADVCTGWIRRLSSTGTASAFAQQTDFPVDLKVGRDGALYYLTRGDGAVHRIFPRPSGVPQITAQPVAVSTVVGTPATFAVTVTGTAPFTFQWQRNGVNITGATQRTFRIAAAKLTDDGASFRCVVRNAQGSVTTAVAKLTVRQASTVVSLRTDVQPIFAARCAPCHVGATLGQLDLSSAATARDNLLDASTCSATVRRVVPGQPAQSALWQRLGGVATSACGGPMPQGSEGLKIIAPLEFAKIETWISQGALDN